MARAGESRGACCTRSRTARGRLGYTVLRLDTGPRQAGAQRLYESEGYRAIANFNANPVASFFGEKRVRRGAGGPVGTG